MRTAAEIFLWVFMGPIVVGTFLYLAWVACLWIWVFVAAVLGIPQRLIALKKDRTFKELTERGFLWLVACGSGLMAIRKFNTIPNTPRDYLTGVVCLGFMVWAIKHLLDTRSRK